MTGYQPSDEERRELAERLQTRADEMAKAYGQDLSAYRVSGGYHEVPDPGKPPPPGSLMIQVEAFHAALGVWIPLFVVNAAALGVSPEWEVWEFESIQLQNGIGIPDDLSELKES